MVKFNKKTYNSSIFFLIKAEIKAIFVDTYTRLMNILEVIDDVKYLKLIIHFNQFSDIEKQNIKYYQKKIEIINFNELLVN